MLSLRIFTSDAAFRRAIEQEAEAIVRRHVAARIRLYAQNPTLLRKASAGFYGIRPEAVPDNSRTSFAVSRAITAFGDELALMEVADLIDADTILADEQVREAILRPNAIIAEIPMKAVEGDTHAYAGAA